MFRRFAPMIGLLAALALGCVPAMAHAQVNIDQGKTPAEIFASDCAACHKTTRGLANGKNSLMLSSFLARALHGEPRSRRRRLRPMCSAPGAAHRGARGRAKAAAHPGDGGGKDVESPRPRARRRQNLQRRSPRPPGCNGRARGAGKSAKRRQRAEQPATGRAASPPTPEPAPAAPAASRRLPPYAAPTAAEAAKPGVQSDDEAPLRPRNHSRATARRCRATIFPTDDRLIASRSAFFGAAGRLRSPRRLLRARLRRLPARRTPPPRRRRLPARSARATASHPRRARCAPPRRSLRATMMVIEVSISGCSDSGTLCWPIVLIGALSAI